jgi:hypothetical protein
MSAQVYIIPSIVSGTTDNGRQFTIIRNGSPVNITAVEATFKSIKATKVLTNGAGFTIIDAVNGVIQMDSQLIDWPFSMYEYKIQLTLVDGSKKVYVIGKWNLTSGFNG